MKYKNDTPLFNQSLMKLTLRARRGPSNEGNDLPLLRGASRCGCIYLADTKGFQIPKTPHFENEVYSNFVCVGAKRTELDR